MIDASKNPYSSLRDGEAPLNGRDHDSLSALVQHLTVAVEQLPSRRTK